MRKSKKSKGSGKGNGDTGMVLYKGPIAASSPTVAQTVRIPLRFVTLGNSSSAGYIECGISTTQVGLSNEWSSYVGLWKEYRVLGIRVQYVAWYDKSGFTGSANSLSAGVIFPYHGPLPAFQGAVSSGTLSAAWQCDGAKPFHPGVDTICEWRMRDVEEAQFISTGGTGQSGGVYGMVPSVSASKGYGTFFVTFLVEFKGRI